MYIFTSKAFQGEFYKSGDYVDCTVTVSSDLYGQISEYATKLKNALIYYATNFTGSPAYVFGNVENIAGNMGVNTGRTPETVPIALDMQIIFERQDDSGEILAINDREYTDSFTAQAIAEHIRDLRNSVVESQYGTTTYAEDFLPIQISANIRETKEAPVPPTPVYTKTIHLYGAVEDIIGIYDTDDNLIETVTFEVGESSKDITFNYTPDGVYTFKSQVAVISGVEFAVSASVPEDAEQTVIVRPDKYIYWFGVKSALFTFSLEDSSSFYKTNCIDVETLGGNRTEISFINTNAFEDIKHTLHSDIRDVSGATTFTYFNAVTRALTSGVTHDTQTQDSQYIDFQYVTNYTVAKYKIYALWYD